MVKDKSEKHEYSKNISELRYVCKIAFDKGLLDTHSGNISTEINKKILITKTGRSLINLKRSDFTAVPLNQNLNKKRPGLTDNVASSELEIHKFILKSFPGSTVLHSHPLNAIALSICLDKIKKHDKFSSSPQAVKNIYKIYPDLNKITPVDFESAYFFPEIYVMPLQLIEDIKSGKFMPKLEAKDIFKENGVFMIKSHGSFSWGKTPLDALRWTMALEASSKIILKLNSLSS